MSREGPSPDLLATIIAATRRVVETREAALPMAELERRARQVPVVPGRFREAISRRDRVNVIAECKRRSPSKGVLRQAYDAAAIARGYRAAGAAAVSVLTEPAFFDGSLADLAAARAVIDIPILRKDFVVTEYQLWEARERGADAVLLIVAALEAPRLAALIQRAAEVGLDALVEVHTADELAIAVDAGASMVGVNNRDLRTLAVDVRASEMLAGCKPEGVVAVSESGLKSIDDVMRLGALGYDAFLIGERFMTAPDPGASLSDFLAALTAVRPA
jgi:indole-3-glycerol phosphate synthase